MAKPLAQVGGRPLPAEFNVLRAELLRFLYDLTNLPKEAPAPVIWNARSSTVRFLEVKRPHWDRPLDEQRKFLAAAEERRIETSIAEWELRQTTNRAERS